MQLHELLFIYFLTFPKYTHLAHYNENNFFGTYHLPKICLVCLSVSLSTETFKDLGP